MVAERVSFGPGWQTPLRIPHYRLSSGTVVRSVLLLKSAVG